MRILRLSPQLTKTAALYFAVFCLTSVAFGQSILKMPEINVFAGYSLVRFDSVPLGYSKTLNLQGGNMEVSLPDLYRGLGIAADFSGHHSPEAEQFNFMIGPQYRHEVKSVQLFGNLLFGKTRTRLLQVGASQLEASTLGYSVAFGGGVDVPLGQRFSIRPIQADYLVSSGFGEKRYDMRYSTGVVIRFGKKSEAPSF